MATEVRSTGFKALSARRERQHLELGPDEDTIEDPENLLQYPPPYPAPPAATKTPRPVMTPATIMESTAVEPAAVEPAQHRSHCRLTTRYQRVIGQHEVERAKIATLSDLIVIAHRVREEDVSGINARLIDIGSKPLARRKQRRRSGTVARPAACWRHAQPGERKAGSLHRRPQFSR